MVFLLSVFYISSSRIVMHTHSHIVCRMVDSTSCFKRSALSTRTRHTHKIESTQISNQIKSSIFSFLHETKPTDLSPTFFGHFGPLKTGGSAMAEAAGSQQKGAALAFGKLVKETAHRQIFMAITVVKLEHVGTSSIPQVPEWS